MEGSESYVVEGVHGTKEGAIVWVLGKEISLDKRLPASATPPKHLNLMEMLKEHEEAARDSPTNPAFLKIEEGWIKRLRKLSKALIKIKNHRTSSFNEEVS